MATIGRNLDRQVKKETISDADAKATLARLKPSTDLAAAAGSALVVEAVFENFAVKKEIFTTLDAACGPETILASNTCSISLTKIAGTTRRADRVIGMHFMNPVPVMKLVEVICGQATSPETLAVTTQVAKDLGKMPVTVQDYPGFVSQPRADAHDQRGRVLPDGRRRRHAKPSTR